MRTRSVLRARWLLSGTKFPSNGQWEACDRAFEWLTVGRAVPMAIPNRPEMHLLNFSNMEIDRAFISAQRARAPRFHILQRRSSACWAETDNFSRASQITLDISYCQLIGHRQQWTVPTSSVSLHSPLLHHEGTFENAVFPFAKPTRVRPHPTINFDFTSD